MSAGLSCTRWRSRPTIRQRIRIAGRWILRGWLVLGWMVIVPLAIYGAGP